MLILKCHKTSLFYYFELKKSRHSIYYILWIIVNETFIQIIMTNILWILKNERRMNDTAVIIISNFNLNKFMQKSVIIDIH
jgi:hypothetical protein